MAHADSSLQLETVRDFPDRLPAMVVKELRQGLRARLFVQTITGFHLLILVLLLPVVVYAQGGYEARNTLSLVWWIFGMVLVILLPLRGLSALSQERSANTLDTLILTNLRMGRIVWHKWLAVAVQIVLTGITLFPYAIMIYAGGGISLPDCLASIMRFMVGGLLMTAVFVALSQNVSWTQRVAPALLLGWFMAALVISPAIKGLTGKESMDDGPGLFWNALIAGVLIYLLLELTAQRLVQHNENHYSGPRLVGLGLTGLAGLPFWPDATPFPAFCVLLVITLVSATSLVEPLEEPQRPRGMMDKIPGLGRGWPHGVIWSLAVWPLAAAVLPAALTGFIFHLAALLFLSRLVLFALPRHYSMMTAPLVFTALGIGLVKGLLQALASWLNSHGLDLLSQLMPFPVFFHSRSLSWRGMEEPVFLTAAVTGLACLLLAFIRLKKHHQAQRREGSA